MTISAHDPLAAYLLVQAGLVRRRELPPVLAVHAREQARVLEGLAAFVRSLPESDERLLLLGTMADGQGQFVPGGTTRHHCSARCAPRPSGACSAVRWSQPQTRC